MGVHDGEEFETRGTRAVTGLLDPVPDEDGLVRRAAHRGRSARRRARRRRLHRGAVVGTPARTSTSSASTSSRSTMHLRHVPADRQALVGSHGASPGGVAAARMTWSADKSFSVDFDVDDVGLVLPLETAGLWGRYEDGRIQPSAGRPHHASKGRIQFGSDAVVLESSRAS